jgi:hypothetical protein
MRKFFHETCLIEVKVGDVIQERLAPHRVGVVNSILLTPNSHKNNSPLVCIIVMVYIDKNGEPIKIRATSDKFQVCAEYNYEEYPSQM